jgi:hypothetical protein
LCLRLSVLDGAMGIRVTVDRGVRGVVDGAARNGRTDGANGTPGSLAWQILLALSEELHVVDDDGEIGLAFTKPRHRSRP